MRELRIDRRHGLSSCLVHAALPRARVAVATFFFVNGMVLASWVPHIPALKSRHGIGDGALGAVLLCMAIGAVVALPMAGWLVERWGSRRTTTLAGLGLCVALPGPVLSPTLPLACLALLALGACNGMLDVSMNAQAVAVEARYGRAIMSSFHALFSLAGLAGAGLAGTMMRLGSTDEVHVVTVAAVTTATLAIASRGLLPTRERVARGPVFARPSGVLLGLGALAFCGLLAEGAMGDWSAVYLRDVLATPADVAAAGFAAFSFAMAAGRFGGDVLARRWGPVRLLRASGLLAAAGLASALLATTPVDAIVGFGVVGLGVANVIPVLFSGAGRVPGVPAGTAIAAVATTGYLGFLAGPPTIGVVAQMTSLPLGLGVVCAACVPIAALAFLVGDPGVSDVELLRTRTG
jgi:MFS family permease